MAFKYLWKILLHSTFGSCVWPFYIRNILSRIKEIKNESTQYSENKLGLANDKREGGPSYMDAIIVIEAQDTLTQGSGGSSSKTIAVEYGNYSTARMQSKIENAVFDEAYIFANDQYIQKYQNKITTNCDSILYSDSETALFIYLI